MICSRYVPGSWLPNTVRRVTGKGWPLAFAPLVLLVLLAGCDVTDVSGPETRAAVADTPTTTSSEVELLSGIAVRGRSTAGIVTLKDVPSGRQFATHTDSGRYDFDVSGLAGPFLLRVVADDDDEHLYALAFKAPELTIGNISPVSSRSLAATLATFTEPVRLADVYLNVGRLATLTQAQSDAAVRAVLARTSPEFHEALSRVGLDPDGINPVSASIDSGMQLDAALQDVRLKQDSSGVEWWEESADGEVLGGGHADTLDFELSGIRFTAEQSLMLPGTSQAFRASVQWGPLFFGTPLPGISALIPTVNGVKWSVSDTSVATITPDGLLTIREVSAPQVLIVRAEYRSGDITVSAELNIQLLSRASVTAVRLDSLPEAIDSPARIDLYTTADVEFPAPASLRVYGGNWEIVAPDVYTQAYARLLSGTGRAVLEVDRLPLDISLRVRATQTIQGEVFVTEKAVLLRRYVNAPTAFRLMCPGSFEFAVPAGCPAEISWADGTVTVVRPLLSVAMEDSDAVDVVADTLTSRWSNRVDPRRVRVTATYAGLQSVQAVVLNPRKTRLTSIDIEGITELPEGGSITLRLRGHWDDGSVAELPAARWSVSDPALGSVSNYNVLQARYILDGEQDRTLIVRASRCPLVDFDGSGCTDADLVRAEISVKIRYRPARLREILLQADALSGMFVSENSVVPLRVTNVWDKRTASGEWVQTPSRGTVQWQTSDTWGEVVDGSLHVGRFGAEPLLAVTARVADPNDAGVVRSRSIVLAAHSYSGQPSTISGGYLLGRDGLARKLALAPTSGSSHRLAAPEPFISDVRKTLGGSAGVSLRQDGTVWIGVPIRSMPLPASLLSGLQASGTSSIPRPIPGLTNVIDIVQTNLNYSDAGCNCMLAALKSDGTVWGIEKLVDSFGSTTFNLTLLSGDINIVAIGSSDHAVIAIKSDGHIWAKGKGATAAVIKPDGSSLSQVIAIAAREYYVLALDVNGVVWGWGSGYISEGVYSSTYATVLAGVSESRAIYYSNAMHAIRKSDGAVFSWGLLPARQGDLDNVAYIAGDFAVQEGGKVWWYAKSFDSDRWLQVTLPDASSVPVALVLQ